MKRVFLPFLLVPFLAAQTAPEVEITAEPSHHLALENQYVRVFQVEIAPHAATLMHRHRHDYFFVTLGDSHISNEIEGNPPVELTLPDGETRFTPGNFAHIARNLSAQPFRNATIELLQDEKLRTAPSRWPMEGGDKDFPGGHVRILFVRDGARVSQIDLEPGATVPSHHYDGPHLLVAVSDLDLRSDVEGQGAMPGHFKSGDLKWLPGGYTHTLTNTGNRPAKFVTVEFPAAKPASDTSTSANAPGQKLIVEVDISASGKVLGIRMVRGLDKETNKKILDAVKGWKFDPAQKDGKPVRVLALVEVNYSEDGKITKAGQPETLLDSR